MMEPLVAKNTHLPARVSKFLVFLFRIGARPGSRFLFLVSYLDGEGVYVCMYHDICGHPLRPWLV